MLLSRLKKSLLLARIKSRLPYGKVLADEIYPAETVYRSKPLNLRLEDKVLFENEYTKQLQQARIYSVKNAVLSGEGYVFCNGQAIPDSIIGAMPANAFNSLLWHKAKMEIEEDNYLAIHHAWSLNYFHWVCEMLPKLIFFKKKFNPNHFVLLLPESYKVPYISNSLEAFNFKQVRYFDNASYLVVKELRFIGPLSQTGNIRPYVANQIRSFYREDVKPQRLIYISRKFAPKRKIVNEDSLLKILADFGFEIVYPDNLSFAEQISLFSGCKLLLSLHGAGLSNMLFMEPDGAVVELRLENDKFNNCYYSLASALGLNYYYDLCKAEDGAKSTFDANFIIDVANIKALLERYVEKRLS
jgi:hypothetical protein